MSAQTVRLVGDLTAITTTLANATGLAFTVNAGITYQFRFLVVFRANTSVGIKLGVTTPAFTTFSGKVRIPVDNSSVTGEVQGNLTSSGDSVLSSTVNIINTNYLSVIEGTIKPSASGTLQLQYALGGGGVGTVTVKANSGGTLQMVA